MANPTWGGLAKAQDDDQTIEEFVIAKITEHKSDEEAHLGTGESLQSHKASEIIDHMADSIVEDKIARHFFPNLYIQSTFNSIDGFEKSGRGIDLEFGGVFMYTTTDLDNYVFLETHNSNVSHADFEKKPILDMRCKVHAQGYYESYFGIGDREGYFDEYFVGFKISNGTLYARVYTIEDVSETLIEISGITVTDYNFYRIEVLDGGVCNFYVNGVLKTTTTIDLTKYGSTCMMYAEIKNKEAGHQAYMELCPFVFSQDS